MLGMTGATKAFGSMTGTGIGAGFGGSMTGFGSGFAVALRSNATMRARIKNQIEHAEIAHATDLTEPVFRSAVRADPESTSH